MNTEDYKTKDYKYTKEEIEAAVKTLREGGVIVYPTETVWGIGCDAGNSEAVQRVFSLKKRTDSRAMISLVANDVMLERFADNIPDVAFELLDAAVEPLTIVLDHPRNIAPALLDADGSAAYRIAGTDFCRELVRRLGRPVVSTSANISGEKAPASFDEIPEDILAGADYVVKAGRDASGTGRPSSVIKISDGGVIRIIRK